jgi:hypothetical protein
MARISDFSLLNSEVEELEEKVTDVLSATLIGSLSTAVTLTEEVHWWLVSSKMTGFALMMGTKFDGLWTPSQRALRYQCSNRLSGNVGGTLILGTRGSPSLATDTLVSSVLLRPRPTSET